MGDQGSDEWALIYQDSRYIQTLTTEKSKKKLLSSLKERCLDFRQLI